MQISAESFREKSTDRNILVVLTVVGIMAILMMSFEILGQLHLLEDHSMLLSGAEILSESLFVLALGWATPKVLRELNTRRQTSMIAQEARLQVQTLFNMTDMLQSAIGYGDANAVLRATALKLLPGLGGALYVFNNSGDR